MRRHPAFLALIVVLVLFVAGCTAPADERDASDDQQGQESPGPSPHVVVGVPDSGIDPYHEAFYRPNRTEHPCTYIAGLPCDMPALEFSVGEYDDFEEAFAADEAIWNAIEQDVWYWIPKTAFVAVNSAWSDLDVESTGPRLMDGAGAGHGTGTVSLVLRENPDALIAFHQFVPSVEPDRIVAERDIFVDDGIPVDLLSVSLATWQVGAPLPSRAACDQAHYFFRSSIQPIVKAAGNYGGSALQDCWNGDPATIVVGGAYPHDRTSEAFSYREADVVSYFCPPYAYPRTMDGYGEGGFCGTSWATPMVAGALSRVILGIRQESGYTGNREGLVLDPVWGLTVGMLRDAMNLTATYEPEPRFGDGDFLGTRVPVHKDRPWLQWGWGFYDSLVANQTLSHLLAGDEVSSKPQEAVTYMETQYTARQTLYGRP